MIAFAWPDKRLTPNAKRRLHWSQYRGAALADRKAGYWATFEQLAIGLRDVRAGLKARGTLPVEIRFYPPDRRKRDDDSMIGAFKHLRDGMCDALGIDDHCLRPVYRVCDPAAPGRVEVSFV